MEKIIRSRRITSNSIEQRVKILQNCAEVEYLAFPLLENVDCISHMFSTRLGGVSKGHLSAMNLSFTRGDDPALVYENFRRCGEILGCMPEDMVTTYQTHTINIREVTSADKGKGITVPREYVDVDGLITNEPGIALITFFADCVPLYFVDPIHKAIGVAHSGWRGTAGRMGENMVKTMAEVYGSDPGEILAAVGPAICVDCYEVSADVAEQFMEYNGAVLPGKAPGKYQLNLWEVNRQILLQSGIREENLAVADVCTCCNPHYLHSHRATGGVRGNLAAFLMLKQ